MAVKVERKWIGPTVWLDFGDGVQTGMQTYVTSISDVRDTPLGPVDFGYTIVAGRRSVERQSKGSGDVSSFPV